MLGGLQALNAAVGAGILQSQCLVGSGGKQHTVLHSLGILRQSKFADHGELGAGFYDAITGGGGSIIAVTIHQHIRSELRITTHIQYIAKGHTPDGNILAGTESQGAAITNNAIAICRITILVGSAALVIGYPNLCRVIRSGDVRVVLESTAYISGLNVKFGNVRHIVLCGNGGVTGYVNLGTGGCAVVITAEGVECTSGSGGHGHRAAGVNHIKHMTVNAVDKSHYIIGRVAVRLLCGQIRIALNHKAVAGCSGHILGCGGLGNLHGVVAVVPSILGSAGLRFNVIIGADGTVTVNYNAGTVIVSTQRITVQVHSVGHGL